MGELIQFRMENEPNSSSGVNIFIPTNCQWRNLNDLIQIRFDLQNETISEVLIVDKKKKQIVGNISSKDQNINIPFTAYCVVRLQNGEGRGGQNGSHSTTKNQVPISSVQKIPLTPVTRNVPMAIKPPAPVVPLSSSSSGSSSSSQLTSAKPLSRHTPHDDQEDDEDETGNSLLHDSCITGHLPSVVTLLKTKIIDQNILNKKSQTPFMLACLYGHLEIAQLFAQSEANLFAEDENWSSAIHFAALNGNVELIDWLITEVGQDPDIANRFGQSAKTIVRLYHHEEAIKYFNCQEEGRADNEIQIEEGIVIPTEGEGPNEKQEKEKQKEEQEPDDEVSVAGNGAESHVKEEKIQTFSSQRMTETMAVPQSRALFHSQPSQGSHSESLFLQACLSGERR
jgi:hypothetical protein